MGSGVVQLCQVRVSTGPRPEALCGASHYFRLLRPSGLSLGAKTSHDGELNLAGNLHTVMYLVVILAYAVYFGMFLQTYFANWTLTRAYFEYRKVGDTFSECIT